MSRLASLLAGVLLLASQPAWAADKGGGDQVGIGVYAAGDIMDSNSIGKGRTVSGFGSEFGGTLGFGLAEVSVLAGSVHYQRLTANDDGTKTTTKLDDVYLGAALRVGAGPLSVRVGRASHKPKSSQTLDGEDTGNNPMPTADGQAWFYGIGGRSAVAANIDLILEFTRFEMPDSAYHIGLITAGLAIHLGR